MDLLRFIPVKLTLMLVAGILLGSYFDPGPLFSLLFAGTSFLLLAISFFWYSSEFNPAFGLALGLTVVAMGILSHTLSLPKNQTGHYSEQKEAAEQLLHLKVWEVLKPSIYQHSYIVQLQAINCRKARGRLLFQLPADRRPGPLQIDDELVLYGSIEQLPLPRNPHEFDYSEYLRNRGIYHRLRPDTALIHSKPNPIRTLRGRAGELRKKVSMKLAEASFSPRELAIVQALLLGERQEIAQDTYEAFKSAGAMHILAISGLHIGILIWFIDLLLWPLKKIPGGHRLCLLLLLALLWAYAFLVGLSASIIRAVSMFSFMAYSWYLKRPSNSFNLLALSMFYVLLVVDARLLFQPGFQMSYAAVFAILWMYPIFQKHWKPRFLLPKKAWQLFCLSLAAQLGVLPISLYYFHQFPGLFMLTNLILLPFLGLVLGMGFINMVLALTDSLPVLLAKWQAHMVSGLNEVVGWIAGQELFVFREIHFDLPKLFLCYVLIIGFVACMRGPTFKKLMVVGMAILAWELWGLYRTSELYKKETIWILQQSKNSLLVHQTGKRLIAASRGGSLPVKLLSAIALGEGIKKIEKRTLGHAYRWKQSTLLIVDEQGVFPAVASGRPCLLLVNSPKVHLGRLLDALEPAIVIADGSNYRSYAARWRKSCNERGIPFHDTAMEGAYRISIAP